MYNIYIVFVIRFILCKLFIRICLHLFALDNKDNFMITFDGEFLLKKLICVQQLKFTIINN